MSITFVYNGSFPTLLGVPIRGDSSLDLAVGPELELLCRDAQFVHWNARVAYSYHRA